MPGAPAVRHPIFARFFDRLSHIMERDAGPHRDELLAGTRGRVIEVGAGNGMNFGHYPATVGEVVAVEPEPYLRAKAQAAAAAAPVTVSVQDAVADHLPFGDGAFDVAVASLVLCSIPDQARALAELHRVVRPGGELRFFEHVRAGDGRKAAMQERLDRWGVWPWLAGGCHCARDTAGAIRAAGFEIDRVRPVDVGPAWGLTNPHVVGVARRA